MKKLLLSGMMAMAFVAVAQSTNPPAGQAATPAVQKAAPAKLQYSCASDGYFVKNTYKVPASKVGCLWLSNQAEFDLVFQLAPPVMYSKPGTPISLAGSVAFALVYEGAYVPQFKVIGVRVNNGVVEIAYTMSKPPANNPGGCVYAAPLIIVVNQTALDKAGGAKTVRFIENGKETGSATAPAAK